MQSVVEHLGLYRLGFPLDPIRVSGVGLGLFAQAWVPDKL